MFSSVLNELANNFGSDKGSLHGDRHRYAQLYDLLLHNERQTTRKLVELGLAQGVHDPAAHHGQSGPRAPGSGSPSLAMWLEYFPHAEITGFDIADFADLQQLSPRFKFVRGDMGNPDDLAHLAATIGTDVDLIIDDASHASYHQQLALRTLLPCVRSGGLYIIEDLHCQPPFFEQNLPAVQRTAEWLEALRQGTGNFSALWDEAAIRALHRQIASLVVVSNTQAPGGRFVSALALIRKA